MPPRPELLKAGALLAAGSAVRALAADSSPKTLPILGVTGFRGPHLTLEAQRRGWRVTHFNRGKTAADGLNDVESLLGDRKGKLDALRGRKWDVVIDDIGETVHDTLIWFHSLPPERQAKLHAGLDAAKERKTLRAWHASHGRTSAWLPASVSWLGSWGVRSAQRFKARIAPAIPR
jgi:hypothetical protein